jgi:hypothetical protein
MLGYLDMFSLVLRQVTVGYWESELIPGSGFLGTENHLIIRFGAFLNMLECLDIFFLSC